MREVAYELLRRLGMTTVFGNPGSTEEAFLAEFPDDFTYVLALQEASAIAMADGYARVTGMPAHVNLHTTVGTGNAMGNLCTAWQNKTPLLVTSGQQTRLMALMEPRLANPYPAILPQPYVKWSHEPLRAQDIPQAFMRGYATAVQPPTGPVYLSLPFDDWDQPADGEPVVRRVSTRVAPDPDGLRAFADVLGASRNPLLVIGAGVDRSGGWREAVALAERLRAPVWRAPFSERVGFPEDHPQFQGVLPGAIGPLGEKLHGYDTVLVVGAPVFRYYAYVAGDYLPPGTRLLHITDDPEEAARAPVGDALLGDAALACAELTVQLPPTDRPPPAAPQPQPAPAAGDPLTPDAVFAALQAAWPADGILVQETPSNAVALHRRLPIRRPASYFTMASGGLGYGLPAAVGIALGERHAGRNRPVIAVIGDGSFQYSVQALWTAAQHRLPVLFVVLVNEAYTVLKSFAEFSHTPRVPGLDLPGLDIPSIARGFGCAAHRLDSPDALADGLREGLAAEVPTVLAVPVNAEPPPLV